MRSYSRTPTEEQLVVLLDREREIASTEIEDLARQVVAHLGSPDPELRDELGFTRLAGWILDGSLTDTAVVEFARTALTGTHHALGESGTDSIFRRSFSVLALAVIVHRDNEREILPDDLWADLIDHLDAFCRNESDFRSLVPGRGWAHAVAHAADVIDECAQSQRATGEECERLLHALVALVGAATQVFVDGEHDRIANALSALCARISVDAFCAAVRATEPEVLTPRAENWKHIVRSLWFRLDESERAPLTHMQSQLSAV